MLPVRFLCRLKRNPARLVFLGLPFVIFLLLLSSNAFSGTPTLLYLTITSFTSQSVSTKANDHLRVMTTAEPTSEGYIRAAEMRNRCWGNDTLRRTKLARISVMMENKNKSVVTCSIWKIGSTLFKRIFELEKPGLSHLHNPYDIPFDKAITTKGGMISARHRYTHRVMFSRNPYSRLLSGFVDKLLAPNPVYWQIISHNAIKAVRKSPTEKSLRCSHDLTFSEYVKYVILALTPGNLKVAKRDDHFNPMVEMCRPCDVNYTFIGKMESFPVDVNEFLKLLRLPQTRQIIRENGSELAADDALRDTCQQPFYFYIQYIDCITKYEALQRAWLKLQIRGLIGNISLPFPVTQAEALTNGQFVEAARAARKVSSKEERKAMQNYHFKKYFETIDLADLEKLRKVYKNDFLYFHYDDKPEELFNRNSKT